MPLRPETRHLYGPEWRKIRARLIEQAEHTCALCQERFPAAALCGAHIYHDPRDRLHLAVFCFSCHARHDSPHRLAFTRRRRAQKHGQLWLFPAMEWEEHPPAEQPDEYRQLWLFSESDAA